MQDLYQEYTKAITTVIPTEHIFTDTLSCLAFGTDGGFYRLEPQVVVRVRSEREMIHCLHEAYKRKLPEQHWILTVACT
jgi:D-lactate dehydrogenase